MRDNLIKAINIQAKRQGFYLPIIRAVMFEELSKKYDQIPLKDLLENHRGGSWGKDFIEGGIQAISLRSPDIRHGFIDFENGKKRYYDPERFKKFKLIDGDILVIKSNGSEDLVGKSQIFFSKSNFNKVTASNFLMILRPNSEKIFPLYLDAFLKSPQALLWRVEKQKTTTGLRNLNSKGYLSIKVPVPKDLEDQKRIYDLFLNLTDGIFSENQYVKTGEINSAFKLIKIFQNLSEEIQTQKKLITQLKQSILQEAIEGKLTKDWRILRQAQEPPIEPAEELLKRIQAEKAELVKAKKIRKSKKLPPIQPKEIPFNLPEGWVWCRLGEITTYGSSVKIKPDEIAGNTWVLDLEDIEKESSQIIQRKIFAERPSKSTKSVFKKGWVLYSKLRPYLDKVVVADSDGVCTTEILPLPIYGKMNPYFLMYSMKTKNFLNYVNTRVSGMKMPRLKTSDGEKALIPLASISEQKAIVQKVEALIDKCKALEAEITKSEENAEMLMQAVLKEAFEGKEE